MISGERCPSVRPGRKVIGIVVRGDSENRKHGVVFSTLLDSGLVEIILSTKTS